MQLISQSKKSEDHLERTIRPFSCWSGPAKRRRNGRPANNHTPPLRTRANKNPKAGARGLPCTDRLLGQDQLVVAGQAQTVFLARMTNPDFLSFHEKSAESSVRSWRISTDSEAALRVAASMETP
jgi:hypothetical protein